MLSSLQLEDNVHFFFSGLNWDNRPLVHSSAPLELQMVQAFFAAIPWEGDPTSLAARSLLAATNPAPILNIEENSFTLSDFFAGL